MTSHTGDQTVEAVVIAAQAAVKKGVTKIQNAPVYATDATPTVPTSLAYTDNGKSTVQSGGYILTWFDLIISVIVPKGNQESAIHWTMNIPQSVSNVFRDDPTISGSCQTYEGDVTWKYINDATNNLVGYEFTIQRVKIQG